MAIVLNPYTDSTGTLFYLVTTTSGGALSYLTAVSASPVVYSNGVPNSLGPPIWANTAHDLPYCAWRLTTPVTGSDAITYTLAGGSLTTLDGTNAAVLAPTAAANYFGANEPGFGGVPAFNAAPTMPLGIGVGYAPFFQYSGYSFTRNARYRSLLLSGAVGTTLDSDFQPLTFTPNTAYGVGFFSTVQSNGIDANAYPVPEGVYSFVFDDVNALDPTNQLKMWLSGNFNTGIGFDLAAGPPGGFSTTYRRSVAGNGTTVTVSYWVSYSSDPNFSQGYNLGLSFYFKSAVGKWGQDGTITDFAIFTPGDSDTSVYPGYSGPYPNNAGNIRDPANPFAPSAYLKAALTADDGITGPAYIRNMESIGVTGQCYQEYADLVKPTAFSFGAQVARLIRINQIRPYNTNPADGTYAWSSPNIYVPPCLPGPDGTDSLGPYIDLSAHGGSTDNGQFMSINIASLPLVAVEFVTDQPHELKSLFSIVVPLSVQPATLPATGVTPVALSGTVTVTKGSQTIVFSNSQTLTPGALSITFADGTGYAYQVVSGSGTTYSIYQAYAGPDGVTTASMVGSVSLQNQNLELIVTGPNTFVCAPASTTALPHSGVVQRIAGTAQINMSPALSGTATVTHNSTAVTLTDSQVLQIGTYWQFSGDSGFYLVKSGSGTSWVISPAFAGSSASGLTVTSAWVVWPLVTGGVGCYSWATETAATWPNTIAWLMGFLGMSDACLEAIADEIAPTIRTNGSIIWEVGLEPWNMPGFLSGWQNIWVGALMQYLDAGTSVNEFWDIPTSGTKILGNYQVGPLVSAHQCAVLQARLDTYGKNIKVINTLNSQGANPGAFAGVAINFATNNGNPLTPGSGLQALIPIGQITGSFYEYVDVSNSSWVTACSTWPLTIMMSWAKHWWKYNRTLQTQYALTTTTIATYGTKGGATANGQIAGLPANVAYELNVTAVHAIGTALNEHDCYYAPGYGDAWQAFVQCKQDAGMQGGAIYSIGGRWGGVQNNYTWPLFLWQGQPINDGSANVFATSAGTPTGPGGLGVCYDRQNASVVARAFQRWIGGGENPDSVSTMLITDGRDVFAGSGMVAGTGTMSVTDGRDIFVGAGTVASSVTRRRWLGGSIPFPARRP